MQVALGDHSTTEVWRSTGEERLASNREQERLIEALLTLASSEGGLDRRQRCDLAVICRTALARGNFDPGRLGLRVATTISPASFEGDARLVERLVANLLDNAIGHNVEAGRVQVSTATRDGEAVLRVTGTGPVIPPREIDRLFQPFQRLDPQRIHHREGHGLGPSIDRTIADAHGATITAAAPPHGGLIVGLAVTAPP